MKWGENSSFSSNPLSPPHFLKNNEIPILWKVCGGGKKKVIFCMEKVENSSFSSNSAFPPHFLKNREFPIL